MVMKQYAVVKDGVVTNTLTASEEVAANRGDAAFLVECPITVGRGDLYDGVNFSRPPFDLSAHQAIFQANARQKLRDSDWTQLADSMQAAKRIEWTNWRATVRNYLQNPSTILEDTVLPDPPYPLDES